MLNSLCLCLQVGTVIVARDKIRVLGSGCNRMPTGLEGQFPWDRYGNNTVDTKYPFGKYFTADLGGKGNTCIPLEIGSFMQKQN